MGSKNGGDEMENKRVDALSEILLLMIEDT